MAKLIRGLVTTALLARAWQFLQRQMAKPENQARAKDLANRAASSARGRTKTRSKATRVKGRRITGRRATA